MDWRIHYRFSSIKWFLFAPLQAVTADQLNIVPSTLVALNVVGGTMAKMVSPQSVAVACAAVGLVGKESALFKQQ